MKARALAVVLSIVILVFCMTAFAHEINSDGMMTSANGIKYWITFDVHSGTIYIHGHNPTDQQIPSSIVIEVDDAIILDKDLTIKSNSSKNISRSIIDGVDVLDDNHDVIVSTFGGSKRFTYNDNFNSSNSAPVPTPYIKNVKITNGTIDGQPSAVAEVTVANPSKQTYPTKLMVHTTGTDGSFYPAAVPPGETRTITVELLDERGSRIAGEARLYTERLNQREGAMDQVEFVGRAGGETRHWNTSYQPVRPPWKDDSYRYRNTSVSDDGGVIPNDGTLLPYAIVGAVLLGWLLRKLRRRPR